MAAETSTERSALNDDELIARWIEPDPNHSGAYNVWIVEYSVPVWALIGHLDAVENSVDRVDQDYAIPVETDRAARASYRKKKENKDGRTGAKKGELAVMLVLVISSSGVQS